MKVCTNCGNKTRNKFCSNKCQKEFEYKEYIRKWKEGKISGLRGKYQISMHIKAYLFDKYNNKCARCGWGEKNEKNIQNKKLAKASFFYILLFVAFLL